MKKDNFKTDVIFRMFPKKEKTPEACVALFPGNTGTNDAYGTCDSYLHVGQHGEASVAIARWTRLAAPEEYAPLFRELTNIGYDLRIVKKFTRKHLQSRINQVKRI